MVFFFIFIKCKIFLLYMCIYKRIDVWQRKLAKFPKENLKKNLKNVKIQNYLLRSIPVPSKHARFFFFGAMPNFMNADNPVLWLLSFKGCKQHEASQSRTPSHCFDLTVYLLNQLLTGFGGRKEKKKTSQIGWQKWWKES